VTSLQTIRLVAARELADRLRNKTFVWGTAIVTVLLVAAIVVPTLFDDGPRRYELGVVGDVPTGFEPALDEVLRAQDASAGITHLDDREAAAGAIGDGELDAVLVEGRELMTDGAPWPTLYAAVDEVLRRAVTAEELDRLGVSEQELAAAFEAHEPLELTTAGDEPEDQGLPGGMVAFAATILLFIAIQVNGNSLLTGAIEEKSSRVVEVLLGSVRPWQLLTAKLAALTVLALGQIGIFVGAGLGANAVSGALEIPATTGATVAVSLLMVVIGFVFYAALYTVAGAMASSVEDAQGTAAPLAFLTVGTYMLVIFAVIPSPRGTLSQVLTYLPPTAPFTVPARVALDAIPGWQIAVACATTLAGTALTVRLAGRLYGAAVLAGGKLNWRAVWRAEPIR
jgi:ABC-2 type transport system permease protein